MYIFFNQIGFLFPHPSFYLEVPLCNGNNDIFGRFATLNNIRDLGLGDEADLSLFFDVILPNEIVCAAYGH
jgi:hypothetical protein